MPVADALRERTSQAIGRLHHWFETMRGPHGYGGPISHWWDSSLIYTGPMLDWRYEGIICGYLNLNRATGQAIWLDKALHAAADLLQGQRPDGQFWNSCFEFGPALGGTPHEAAADIALLKVAQTLRAAGASDWKRYLFAAERSIHEILIGRLWNGRGFKEKPDQDWLVANKNATTLEALLLYQTLTGEAMQQYIDGAARVVLDAQAPSGPRAGAAIHVGTHKYQLTFGIYTARCVNSLARLMAQQPRAEYRRFIEHAVGYLGELIQSSGTLLGHYRSGRPIAAPLWVSPSGELLRALLLAREYTSVPAEWIERLTLILVEAQYPTGGIPTAVGFAALGKSQLFSGLAEFRDVLPVVGWCSMAFYALTMIASCVSATPTAQIEIACQWQGRKCRYYEDDLEISLTDDQSKDLFYLWRKVETYPTHVDLWI
jgi:hypothetical protein